MLIRRITDQPRSLEQFYGELAALEPSNGLATTGRLMLSLLHALEHVEGQSVWAMTSPSTLCLVSGDDYTLPILVAINAFDKWYYIEFRMQSKEDPWPDAYVKGQTDSLQRAVEMIQIGLKRSLSI